MVGVRVRVRARARVRVRDRVRVRVRVLALCREAQQVRPRPPHTHHGVHLTWGTLTMGYTYHPLLRPYLPPITYSPWGALST